MTGVAGIRDFEALRRRWRNELERMRPNVGIRELYLDLRHVARYALIARAPGRVMSMRLDGRRMGPVRRFRPVAFQAENICRLQQIGVVVRPVNIVATE